MGKLPRRTVECSILSQTPDNTKVTTTLVSLSLGNKSISACHEKAHLSNDVRALIVCCGCRLRFRVPLHQATDTKAHLLGARDIECHVSEHQHSPRHDCFAFGS